uniref:C2H2-type domain-containing protein n=1 Tax=Glossina brevipalpis TaxID=37001 RepID=A0A1A9WYM9_9MUSC
MEEFGYQINESTNADTIDLSFINRTDFSSNSDVDAEQVFLNSIEPISDCHDSSAFFNPMNDILGDLNEFGKNFYADHSESSQSQQLITPNNSCSWPGQENASFTNIFIPQTNTLSQDSKMPPSHGSINIYDTGAPDQPIFMADNEVEFRNSNCTYNGPDYPSNLNQWFFNLEQQQQQLSYMSPSIQSVNNTSVPPFNTTNQANVNYSTNLLNPECIGPSSSTVVPISMENNLFVNQNNTQLPKSSCIEQPSVHVQNIPSTQVIESSCGAFNKDFETKREPVEQLEWKFGNLLQMDSNNFLNRNSSTFDVIGNPIMNNSPHFRLQGQNIPQANSTPMQRNYLEASQPPVVTFNKNGTHWNSMFPRKHLIQQPEMIVMHPLRTRKLLAPKRFPSANVSLPLRKENVARQNLNTYTDAVACSQDNPLDLTVRRNEDTQKNSVGNESPQSAQLFDDLPNFNANVINIPMIKERSRSENRSKNRRKQKFQIIPGSENIIFEMEHAVDNDTDDVIPIQDTVEDHEENSKNEGTKDPYPEMELPEIDEIFRRKKKPIYPIPAIGAKRNYQLIQPVAQDCASVAKRAYQNIDQSSPKELQESSASFEEKVSVSKRKTRSYFAINKNGLTYSTDSDSEENVKRDGHISTSKSLKCTKCKKIFKTTRSLAIHTKRCINSSSQEKNDICPIIVTENKSNGEKNTKEIPKTHSDELQSLPMSKEEVRPQSNHLLSKTSKSQLQKEISPHTTKRKPRPVTRSQSKQSTGRSKRSK